MTDRAFTISKSQIADLLGDNYGGSAGPQIEPSDPLALACSVMSAVADELTLIRQAVHSDEDNADEIDRVLWRLARRLEGAADVAWHAHRADDGLGGAT